MLVRKSEIIDILSETKLTSSNFMNQYGEVCAVGAILMQLVKPGTSREELEEIAERNAPRALAPSAKPYIESGDYLSALSIHFENVMVAYDDVYQEDVREELLRFVTIYFPSEISVDVQTTR